MALLMDIVFRLSGDANRYDELEEVFDEFEEELRHKVAAFCEEHGLEWKQE